MLLTSMAFSIQQCAVLVSAIQSTYYKRNTISNICAAIRDVWRRLAFRNYFVSSMHRRVILFKPHHQVYTYRARSDNVMSFPFTAYPTKNYGVGHPSCAHGEAVVCAI